MCQLMPCFPNHSVWASRNVWGKYFIAQSLMSNTSSCFKFSKIWALQAFWFTVRMQWSLHLNTFWYEVSMSCSSSSRCVSSSIGNVENSVWILSAETASQAVQLIECSWSVHWLSPRAYLMQCCSQLLLFWRWVLKPCFRCCFSCSKWVFNSLHFPSSRPKSAILSTTFISVSIPDMPSLVWLSSPLSDVSWEAAHAFPEFENYLGQMYPAEL